MITKKTIIYAVCSVGLLFAVIAWIGQHLPLAGEPGGKLVCSIPGKTADPSLKTSDNLTLRKLAEYETVCKGAVVNKLMTFSPMPKTTSEATIFAQNTARTLKEFASHSISPLVVFEPSLTSRTALADIRSGAYDEALASYFKTLKSLGIRDKDMGTWVLFPEANTPTWHTTDPLDFAANVTKVGQLQKSVFPDSKVSILLNSYSYPSNDSDWGQGELKSLLPYVKDLPAGLIDSLGYQGFPSVAEANAEHQYRLLNARDFLPSHIAAEAARSLNVKKIWLNTGSFSRIYAGDNAKEVLITPDMRREILRTILRQARELKSQEFSVSINLFSENKSLTAEHIDWSYWHSDAISESPDKENFMWFVHVMQAEGMTLSLYDHI